MDVGRVAITSVPQGGPQNGTIFVRLTSSNICQFSNFFHCRAGRNYFL